MAGSFGRWYGAPEFYNRGNLVAGVRAGLIALALLVLLCLVALL